MKSLIKILLLVALFQNHSVAGQSQVQPIDTLNQKSLLKKSILPASLIGLGLLVNHSALEKSVHTNIRNSVGNTYEFHIDDYLQFGPAVAMYGADLLGVHAKNHWFDQTKYLFISNMISSTITFALKRITNKTRPNGSVHSFPSGHTTFAFTNATVLYNEFQNTSPLLAYSGYAMATTTGVFRMINNKHWLSDVLVGAGIGIVVTQLVYHFEPFKNFNPFKKYENVTLIPQMIEGDYGFYFAYRF